MNLNRSRYKNSSVFRKPQLLEGVYAMGFNRPSKIQENALPMMLAEPYVHILSTPFRYRKDLKDLAYYY